MLNPCIALQERQASVESRLAQQAALVAQHVRQQALGGDAMGGMPLPENIDGLKQGLLACAAAARHASSLQVCKRLLAPSHTTAAMCPKMPQSLFGRRTYTINEAG